MKGSNRQGSCWERNVSARRRAHSASATERFSIWPLLAGSLLLSTIACGGGSSKPTISVPPSTPACAASTGSAVRPAKAALPSAAAPQALLPITPQYFGMHIDVQALPGGNPPLAWPSFPFGTVRMNSTETRWSDIDTCAGCAYDFSTLDQWRSLYQKNEAVNAAGNYQIIFTFSSVPSYISSNPTSVCNFKTTSGHQPGSCYPPSDIAASCTNSDGLNDCDGKADGTDATFTKFVTGLAQHAAGSGPGQIHYWEMWNEPNDITFWSGSLAQLARMAQDARCVIVGGQFQAATRSLYSSHGD